MRSSVYTGSNNQLINKLIKFLVIFVAIAVPHTNADCVQCSLSPYQCRICYQSCSNYQFVSCTNPLGAAIDQEDCIQDCCRYQQRDRHEHHFTSETIRRCITNQIKDTNVSFNIWYIIVVILGSLVILILLIVTIRALYFLRRSGPSGRRVVPSLQQNSIINLNSNQNPLFRSNPEVQRVRDFPENSDNIIKDETNTCCICLDGNVTSITRCGHVFHLSCLAAWISRKSACPLCNYKNINETKVYCPECKQLRKSINLRNASLLQIQSLKKGRCQNCKG